MLRKFSIALCAWMLVACAPLDLSGKAPLTLESGETLVLISARLQNTREPKASFTAFLADFSRSGVIMTKAGTASESAVALADPSLGQVFLLVAKVKSGKNELTWLKGQTERPATLVAPGVMNFGVSGPFVARPGAVQYLGFLDIENVDTKSKWQQSTGPALPVIDQALAGLSKGTLAIRLVDQSNRDVEQFRRAFPALARRDIQVTPLKQLTLEPRVIKPALKEEPSVPAETVVLEATVVE